MIIQLFNYTIEIKKTQYKELENKGEDQQVEENLDEFDKEYGFLLKYGITTKDRYCRLKSFWFENLYKN